MQESIECSDQWSKLVIMQSHLWCSLARCYVHLQWCTLAVNTPAPNAY